jgi:hypothetical protein
MIDFVPISIFFRLIDRAQNHSNLQVFIQLLKKRIHGGKQYDIHIQQGQFGN